MKKIASVKNIVNENFNVKIGTFDKKNPESFYVEGSAYIEPKNNFDFKAHIARIRKGMNHIIRDISYNNKGFLKSDFINVLDLPVERMSEGKKSYLFFEYHLKQSGNKSFKEIIDNKSSYVDPFLNKFKELIEHEDFILYKKK